MQSYSQDALFNALPCGLLSLDEHGYVLSANATFLAWAGRALDEVMGKAFGELLGPGGRVFAEAHLLPLLRLQGHIDEVYVSLKTRDTAVVPTLLSAVLQQRDDKTVMDCVFLPMRRRHEFEDYLVQAKRITDESNAFLEAQVLERTREIRTLAAELATAEQRERQALARTLHDGVQQELYAIQFSLAGVRRKLTDDTLTQAIAQAEASLKNAMQMARDLASDLQPTVLNDSNFLEVLTYLSQTMQQKHGLSVHINSNEPVVIQHEPTRTLLYNLSREMLFNVVKHAQTNTATLSIRLHDERLSLTIQDNGIGFNPEHATQGTGLGLNGAQKRLQLFGGTLDIHSQKTQGTRVTLSVPAERLNAPPA